MLLFNIVFFAIWCRFGWAWGSKMGPKLQPWSILGTFGVTLKALGDDLGAILGALGPSWVLWGAFGALWGHFGEPFGKLRR